MAGVGPLFARAPPTDGAADEVPATAVGAVVAVVAGVVPAAVSYTHLTLPTILLV